MKKILFSLGVLLMTLASCTPSAIEIEPGSAAEAAQKFFTACKDKNFEAAAEVGDLGETMGLSEETLKGLLAKSLNTAFGDMNFEEIFVTEAGEEADGVVKVKLYGTIDGDSGYLTVPVKKVGEEWKVDWQNVE